MHGTPSAEIQRTTLSSSRPDTATTTGIRTKGTTSLAPGAGSSTARVGGHTRSSSSISKGLSWIQRRGAGLLHLPKQLTLDAEKYLTALEPYFAEPSQMVSEKDAFVLNIVGGGPMGTETCLAVQDRMGIHLDDIKTLETVTGRPFRLGINVVDEQPKEHTAQGQAWSGAHGLASMNTGFEDKAVQQKDFGAWVNKRKDTIAAYLKPDPMLSALFRSGFDAAYKKSDTQTVTHHRSFLPRAVGGLYYLGRFAGMLVSGKRQLGPRLTIKLVCDTKATGVELGQETSSVKLTHKDKASEHAAHLTMVATGTTLSPPITDPAVAPYCYQGPMNSKDLGNYLSERNLLVNGKLRPGAVLALGGTQLSLFDQIIAVAPFMDLWTKAEGEPGYRVSDTAAEKYKGAFIFVSSEGGSLVNPRTALESAGTSTQDHTISNELELWSLAMADAPYGLDAYSHMAYLLMARTLGVGIDEVIKRCTDTESLALAQMKDVGHFFSHMQAGTSEGKAQAARTFSGGFRQQLNANYEGRVASQDPASALEKLKSVFGFAADMTGTQQFIQAWMSMATEHGAPRETMAAYTRMFQFVAASPAHIQIAAGMLFKAGIASHVPCRYENLQPLGDETPGGVRLPTADGTGTQEAQAFIVSRTFDPEKNEIYESLAGQTEPLRPEKAYPAKTTWGRFANDDKGHRSNLMDYGLSGTGTRVDGKTYGATTIDINNHPSSMSAAASAAVFTLGPAVLRHAGVKDPLDAFHRIVDQKTRIHLEDPKKTSDAMNDAIRQGVKRTEVARQVATAHADAGQAGRLAELAMQARPSTPTLEKALGETLGPQAAANFREAVDAKTAALRQDASTVQGTMDHFTDSRRDLTRKEQDAIMAEVMTLAHSTAESLRAQQ